MIEGLEDRLNHAAEEVFNADKSSQVAFVSAVTSAIESGILPKTLLDEFLSRVNLLKLKEGMPSPKTGLEFTIAFNDGIGAGTINAVGEVLITTQSKPVFKYDGSHKDLKDTQKAHQILKAVLNG